MVLSMEEIEMALSMERLLEIVAAMDEEEKKIIVTKIDSDIMRDELQKRDLENRNTIAAIEEVLNKREYKWN